MHCNDVSAMEEVQHSAGDILKENDENKRQTSADAITTRKDTTKRSRYTSDDCLVCGEMNFEPLNLLCGAVKRVRSVTFRNHSGGKTRARVSLTALEDSILAPQLKEPQPDPYGIFKVSLNEPLKYSRNAISETSSTNCNLCPSQEESDEVPKTMTQSAPSTAPACGNSSIR